MKYFLLALFISFVAPVYSFEPTITPGLKGMTLTWDHSDSLSYSVYRGTTSGSYELIAKHNGHISIPGGESTSERYNKSSYLDTTAEPEVQYFYKIVGETKELTATIERIENVVFLRDFCSGDVIATPASKGAEFGASNVVNAHNPAVTGYGFRVIDQPAIYQRYVTNIKPGAKYTARVTFGTITGAGKLRLSLSDRKPVADVIVGAAELKTYANQTIEFPLVGGPQDWNQIYMSVVVAKGSTTGGFVYIKKLVILED